MLSSQEPRREAALHRCLPVLGAYPGSRTLRAPPGAQRSCTAVPRLRKQLQKLSVLI